MAGGNLDLLGLGNQVIDLINSAAKARSSLRIDSLHASDLVDEELVVSDYLIAVSKDSAK